MILYILNLELKIAIFADFERKLRATLEGAAREQREASREQGGSSEGAEGSIKGAGGEQRGSRREQRGSTRRRKILQSNSALRKFMWS